MTTPLRTKVFMSSERHFGLGVTSTIIYGPSQALLVDAQFTLANAHRLVAELIETGRELTQVFISHIHPDHYLGLEVVVRAFPEARVIAYGEIADEINDAFPFKIEYWSEKLLGRNGARTAVPVERIHEPRLWVDGHEVEIIGVFRGDSAHAAAVWEPSTRTLVAADAAVSDTHAWVADARTPADRQEWLDTLDRLEALDPKVVVPGHAPSDRPYDPDSIGFTRRYLRTFIRHLKESADSKDLVVRMDQEFPGLAGHVALEKSAQILRDGYRWDGDYPESLRNTPAVI
ncbi:MBL fold metallo-hydrolase [Streptomyces sediminimaris]|uniref:MBL fold metallo-hydrolase n=1 Tax=Streptomyces sediminimaris TaxID=3383721 RepID=UPI0039995E1E